MTRTDPNFSSMLELTSREQWVCLKRSKTKEGEE